ncbi:MAG: hypothetical protein RDV48_01160 [Candidatus Eremiobacteraeota bacterium]|nr:hypothetical protein [Candidatus Eremiobacteraeota bacterium]
MQIERSGLFSSPGPPLSGKPLKGGEGLLKSHRDKALMDMYERYRESAEQAGIWDRLGHNGFFSDYAITNAQEYLADGIMFYTKGERSREILKKADPSLYGYISDLMALRPGEAAPREQAPGK